MNDLFNAILSIPFVQVPLYYIPVGFAFYYAPRETMIVCSSVWLYNSLNEETKRREENEDNDDFNEDEEEENELKTTGELTLAGESVSNDTISSESISSESAVKLDENFTSRVKESVEETLSNSNIFKSDFENIKKEIETSDSVSEENEDSSISSKESFDTDSSFYQEKERSWSFWFWGENVKEKSL